MDNIHLFSKGHWTLFLAFPLWTDEQSITHTHTHTPTDNLQSPVHLYAAYLWMVVETGAETLKGTSVEGRHFWKGVDERLLNLTEYSRQKTVLLIQSRSIYSKNPTASILVLRT